MEETNTTIYLVQMDQLEPCKSEASAPFPSWLPLSMAVGPRVAVPLHAIGIRAGCDVDVVQVLGGQCRAACCPTEPYQWGSGLAAIQRAVSGGEISEPSLPPPQEVPPLQALTVGRLQPWPERGGGPRCSSCAPGGCKAFVPLPWKLCGAAHRSHSGCSGATPSPSSLCGLEEPWLRIKAT